MEFRFRAGDDKPPPSSSTTTTTTWLSSSSTSTASSFSCDGYFTAQAMRAGLLGPAAAPFGWEVMRRERIREELLREEVQRRVIEEEVRRELEMELAVARRLHGVVADAFMSPPPPPMPPMMPFEELRVREGFGRFDPRGRAGFGFGERLLLEEEKKKPPLVPKHKLELREIEPSESSEVPPLEPQVTGMKRKADAIAATTAPPKLQKPAQDWSCALCQVSATSEAGLNEHLEGKKHKAKLAQRGAIKMTNNEKSGFKATIGNKNDTIPNDAPKKISIQVDGAMHEVVQKNNYLWCERCRVRCDNNVTMAGHLRGKKHRESNKVWKPIKAARINSKNKENSTAGPEIKLDENGPVESTEENKEGGEASTDVALPALKDE